MYFNIYYMINVFVLYQTTLLLFEIIEQGEKKFLNLKDYKNSNKLG